MRLIYLGGAWIAGVLAGSLFQPSPACLLIGLLPLPMLLRRRWQPVLLASLGIFLFFSGALYFQSVLPTDDAGYLGYYNDSGTAAIRGTVWPAAG